MSAVGTTLLKSPGWNEGKSPIWNPGYTRTKSNIELRRSGTITRAFVLRLRSAAPLGLNKCIPIINPGLAPWAMREYRPYRAHLRLSNQYTLLFWCGCPFLMQGSLTCIKNSPSIIKYNREYDVLVSVSTRTYLSEYTHLSQWVHALTMISTRK